MRNKSGIEIKKGNWIRYTNARGDETEAYIRSIDRSGPMAKTRGAWLHLTNGDSCNADYVIETLGPMTVSKGGVVKQNPVVRGESNEDAARYAELFGGSPDTIRAWNDHYLVRFHKPGEKIWTLAATFKRKTDAMKYAQAYARENPTHTVSVIDKA